MKQAVYAGSFDPWTFGHQFVLNSALAVFDRVHIVSAINLAKQSTLKPDIRARIIAHAIDPFCDWWSQEPPFVLNNSVVVTSQEGLIADYAQENNITHLVRGLRSTTDFESEFNLYFANQAINTNLQTWAIMCPPRLLHCSSTYVKSVVGRPHVKFVGTPFICQSLMLGWERIVGQIFDLIETCSKHRFDSGPFNLNSHDFSECLQLLFSNLYANSRALSTQKTKQAASLLDEFLKNQGAELRTNVVVMNDYPEADINYLWALLSLCFERQDDIRPVPYLLSLAKKLGKTSIKLFIEDDVSAQFENLMHTQSI